MQYYQILKRNLIMIDTVQLKEEDGKLEIEDLTHLVVSIHSEDLKDLEDREYKKKRVKIYVSM